MKVLILGINGFIGNSLSEKILSETDWELYGMDIREDKLSHQPGPDATGDRPGERKVRTGRCGRARLTRHRSPGGCSARCRCRKIAPDNPGREYTSPVKRIIRPCANTPMRWRR